MSNSMVWQTNWITQLHSYTVGGIFLGHINNCKHNLIYISISTYKKHNLFSIKYFIRNSFILTDIMGLEGTVYQRTRWAQNWIWGGTETLILNTMFYGMNVNSVYRGILFSPLTSDFSVRGKLGLKPTPNLIIRVAFWLIKGSLAPKSWRN